MVPLAPAFDLLAPHLAPALVSGAARAAVRGLMGRLPAPVGRWIYLECRLAEGEDRVDLIVGCPLRAAQPPRVWPADAAPDAQDDMRGCHRALGVANRMAHAVGRGADRRAVWLEFDVAADGSPAAVPSLFLNVAPPGRRTAGRYRETLARAGRAAMDDRTSSTSTRALHRVLQHVPAGAAVYYMGVMLSRQPATVRVCLAGLVGERLYEYARRIGWPGNEARLRETVDAVGAVTARGNRAAPVTLVHIDIAEDILPVMGIEYVFSRRCQLHGTLSEQPLIDRLVPIGLCTPSKRDALRAWSGWSIDHWAGECWPSVIVRRVNHLKLVHGSRGETAVKVYLSVHHRFLQGLSGVRAATGAPPMAA